MMRGILVCFFTIIILVGCADMRAVQHTKHEDYLVMKVVSGAGQVGLVGIASGRAVNEAEQNSALTQLRAKHPEWHWASIAQKEISVGMTDAEVLLSWGQPHRVNRASYGNQWVYCRGLRNCIPAQYVYFDNMGTVTAWN